MEMFLLTSLLKHHNSC